MVSDRLIYMDHAATTATHPEVVKAMLPYFTEQFGNPSSVYEIAARSKEAVAHAREQVAAALGASPREIYFTSGGTESDNWALKGVAFANQKKGTHIITTVIEHHAILHTCEWLEKHGFSVTYLPVDRYGMVDPAAVEEAITDQTILISVMTANNEIGTIQPIAEIGAIAHKHDVLFHTDAVQAIGQVAIDVEAMQIDLLSLSGHKFAGPKGTGALYVRKSVRLDPLIHGGAQERNRRAGTENVPGIVGLGVAIERATRDIPGRTERIAGMRDRLIHELLKVPHTRLNGHPTRRLPNNVNVAFEYIEGESILLMLNAHGIAASTGSACSSASLDPSHVLLGCGIPAEQAHGSLRLTLGEETTEEEIERVLEIVPGIVQRLRDMSPLTPPELRTR
jgi:cysteine desulfurase